MKELNQNASVSKIVQLGFPHIKYVSEGLALLGVNFVKIISDLVSLFHTSRHHATCLTVLNLLLSLSQII